MRIADPNALYIIWAGGNDIRTGGSGSDAALNVINAVNTLLSIGATQFLVPNMPDIGLAPVAGADAPFLTAEAESFNSFIESKYVGLSTITVVDVFDWHHEVVSAPSAFLDNNGQFKLQVYADGFAPAIQIFDEFKTTNDVRMARATECQ